MLVNSHITHRILPGMVIAFLLFSLSQDIATTPEPFLVADINPTPGIGSSLLYLTPFGDTLLFIADDGNTGEELWLADNTTVSLVKDIAPGLDPLVPTNLKVNNGLLYFSGNDGSGSGEELWVSDGTITGTVLLKDINPTGDSTPTRFNTSNGVIYFQAKDDVHGYELWKSDGTPDGTVMVKDINPVVGASSSPTILTDVNGILFFVAIDDTHGEELWKSDGTPEGTLLVKDINPGIPGSTVRSLHGVGDTLFFRANDGAHGDELWKSDGSETGTVLVKDIHTGEDGALPGDFETLNGLIYFQADDGINGAELWKSDGTDNGTEMVKDIEPGAISSYPTLITGIGGVIYFSAFHSSTDRELWKSDGSEAGTQLVKDINPSGASTPLGLKNVNGKLIFQATDDIYGTELWSSGGSEESTGLVKDINPGTSGSTPNQFAIVQNMLYFVADDGEHGRELWGMDLQNLPPSVEAGGSYMGPEGSMIPVTGNADDESGPVSVEWISPDAGCVFSDTTTLQTSLTCSDDGQITVTLQVTDWWNVIVTDTATVTVSNAAPQIILLSLSTELAQVGEQVDATVIYSDPGQADTHTASIDWNDGTTDGMIVEDDLDTATASHVYNDPGDYTIQVIVVDDDGAQAESTIDLAVYESIQWLVFLPLIER